MRGRPSVRQGGRCFVLLTAFALMTVACGQTVPRTPLSGAPVAGGGAPAAAGGAGGGGALSLPSGSTGSGGGGTTSGTIGGSTTSGGTTGGGSATGGGTSAGGGSSSGGTTGGGGTVGISAPGVTATTINIGTFYQKNQGSANAAIGAGGLDQGDQRKPWNVIIHMINSAGGIAGRKLVPKYYGFDANSTQTADQNDQAACNYWTQDNKVFAIFYSSPVTDECAKKAGAIEFGQGIAGTVPETYQRYPNRIDIDTMNMVRMGSVTVDGLAKQGYFDQGAKIGLVTWDDPNYREAITKGYEPALARHGLSSALPPAYLHVPQTPQEIGQTSADVSNAVLKFQSQGIDHVMILDGPAGACGGFCITLEWMQQANSQRYYPRYGFNDTNSAKEGQQYLPNAELKRSVIIKWIDFDKSDDAGWHQNLARNRCYAIMRKHGIDMSNPNAQGAALGACENLWFFQMAATHLSGPLNVPDFVNAIESLGYSYTSTSAYANFFSSSRHDGTAGVRALRFVGSCTCYRFTTDPYRV